MKSKTMLTTLDWTALQNELKEQALMEYARIMPKQHINWNMTTEHRNSNCKLTDCQAAKQHIHGMALASSRTAVALWQSGPLAKHSPRTLRRSPPPCPESHAHRHHCPQRHPSPTPHCPDPCPLRPSRARHRRCRLWQPPHQRHVPRRWHHCRRCPRDHWPNYPDYGLWLL